MRTAMTEDTLYDCIVIGAGPGGLQAATYLARYNRQSFSSTGAAGQALQNGQSPHKGKGPHGRGEEPVKVFKAREG